MAERELSREPTPELTPCVYIASLSDYNAGWLHGSWIDAAQSVDQLAAAIEEMLDKSREPIAEEWAIHDYEGFGTIRLGEYESLERLSQLGLGLEAHGYAFAAWVAYTDEVDVVAFEASYLGRHSSLTAYADDVLDDLGLGKLLEVVPEGLRPYVQIDAAGFGRDLELGGDIFTAEAPDGDVFVYTTNG